MRSLRGCSRLGIVLCSLFYSRASRAGETPSIDTSSSDSQHVFSHDPSWRWDDLDKSSPDIFSSVHGLLRNWPQAFAPNGWNVVPGYVPAGTHLYHGAAGASYPTSGFEWFAFDPEHAYYFAVMQTGMLHTFVATAPLPVLYFDGVSASKNAPGAQDLQHVLAYGNDTSKWIDDFEGEWNRSSDLCDWVQSIGFGGIVREETAFELIWCDFSHSVAHVRAFNTSTPFNSTETPVLDSTPMELNGNNAKLLESLAPHSGNRFQSMERIQEHRLFQSLSLYARKHEWSLLGAASAHFTHREPQLILSIPHMVSLHDPKYTSIRDQYAYPNRKRRLVNISSTDISRFKEDIAAAGVSWRSRSAYLDGPDYGGIIEDMMNRKTVVFRQMNLALNKANATEAFLITKLLAYGDGLFAYFSGPEALNTGLNAPPVQQQLLHLREGVETCARSRTTDDPVMASKNDAIRWAIERVQRRICEFEGYILMDALQSDLRREDESRNHRHLVDRWQKELDRLLDWLKWPTLQTCPGGCGDDEICFVSMWPMNADGHFTPRDNDSGDVHPKCIGLDLLD